MQVLQQKKIAKILNCSKSKVCRLIKEYRADLGLKPYTPIVWELFADWLGIPESLIDSDKKEVK